MERMRYNLIWRGMRAVSIIRSGNNRKLEVPREKEYEEKEGGGPMLR